MLIDTRDVKIIAQSSLPTEKLVDGKYLSATPFIGVVVNEGRLVLAFGVMTEDGAIVHPASDIVRLWRAMKMLQDLKIISPASLRAVHDASWKDWSDGHNKAFAKLEIALPAGFKSVWLKLLGEAPELTWMEETLSVVIPSEVYIDPRPIGPMVEDKPLHNVPTLLRILAQQEEREAAYAANRLIIDKPVPEYVSPAHLFRKELGFRVMETGGQDGYEFPTRELDKLIKERGMSGAAFPLLVKRRIDGFTTFVSPSIMLRDGVQVTFTEARYTKELDAFTIAATVQQLDGSWEDRVLTVPDIWFFMIVWQRPSKLRRLITGHFFRK